MILYIPWWVHSPDGFVVLIIHVKWKAHARFCRKPHKNRRMQLDKKVGEKKKELIEQINIIIITNRKKIFVNLRNFFLTETKKKTIISIIFWPFNWDYTENITKNFNFLRKPPHKTYTHTHTPLNRSV